MRIQCDVCEKKAATVVCCADEAALCSECDLEIHAANRLASKHQRLPLHCEPKKLPLCDICQEKAALIFCVEDRALFCRSCDESIHVEGSLSGGHQRLLATGISVGLISSACKNHNIATNPNPSCKSSLAPKPKAQQTTSNFTQSVWSVDDFLQLSDYECSDKKGSGIEFSDVDWFSDIGVFHDQTSNEYFAAAEVPELHNSSVAVPFRAMKSNVASKRARIDIVDDDEFFTVPDLG